MTLEKILDWYQNLSPQSVADVAQFYDEQARFIDPFNDVVGHDGITAIFHHMFEKTEQPHFHIEQSQQLADSAWVHWRFSVTLLRRNIEIEGVSQLIFADDGRIKHHRDYWDASELFAQLPVIGTMVRKLKQQMQAVRPLHVRS